MMYSKEMLLKLIEKETTYLNGHEVGSEEYNKSMSRLVELEGQLAELEKFDSEQKNKTVSNVIEVGKFILGSVVIPVVGLVAITAVEKDITFTGALREYTRYFLPKKMN